MGIVEYDEADCKAVADLFFDTVHEVNLKDYSEEQVRAWAGETIADTDYGAWGAALSSTYTLVAKEGDVIIGFGNITKAGHLDRLYTHKDFQGRGIASALLCKLEDYARGEGHSAIESDVSITAKSFFEKSGFRVVAEQKQRRNGVVLVNYKMRKECAPAQEE